jgi:hypothetical protein
MTISNKWKNAKTTMFLGMVFLSLALISLRLTHFSAIVGEGWADGLRGMLFGMSIGFNLWSVKLAKRERGGGGTKPLAGS